MSCYNDGGFKKDFTENMNALGLTVPSGLFDTYEKAIATAGALASTLSNGAAYYVGAVIGSIVVANTHSVSCGSRISGLFVFLSHQPELRFEGWYIFYTQNPGILTPSGDAKLRFIAKAIGNNKRIA